MGTSTEVQRLEFETAPLAFGVEADPDHIRRLSAAAEEVNFDALRFPDHIALPRDIPPEYPFSESGEYPFDHTTPTYDVFDVLSFVCGCTESINLKSNVCVVPFRHPVTLAKNVLSLCSLSRGRFEFGVGLGWLRTEFEVLDVPYKERGPRTDEFLDLFHRVCEEPVVDFDGKFHSFPETGFYPRPHRDGGPPILVGGYTGAAFRRIAEYGDGWVSAGTTALQDIENGKERLLTAWNEYNRHGEPSISATVLAYEPGDTDLRSIDDLREKISQLAEVGVTRVNLHFRAETPEEHVRQVKTVGEEVLPSGS